MLHKRNRFSLLYAVDSGVRVHDDFDASSALDRARTYPAAGGSGGGGGGGAVLQVCACA